MVGYASPGDDISGNKQSFVGWGMVTKGGMPGSQPGFKPNGHTPWSLQAMESLIPNPGDKAEVFLEFFLITVYNLIAAMIAGSGY